MIEITERDKEFLLALNFSGACDNNFVHKFYPKRYGRKRMERLDDEKVINRSYGMIILGLKGKEYLEGLGEVPRVVSSFPKNIQKRLIKATNLKYEIPSMNIVLSSEYKRIKKLNRGMQFLVAGITKDNIDYLIYDVPLSATRDFKELLLKEFKNKKNVINNAIVLTKNNSFVQSLAKMNVPIGELLVLPCTKAYLTLLNKLGEGDFDKNILGSVYPEIRGNKQLNMKDCKYIINNATYINMVLNNESAFSYILGMDRLLTSSNSKTGLLFKIVCLNSQQQYMESRIKNLELNLIEIEINTLSLDEVLKL